MDIADLRHAVYLTVHEFPKRRGLNSVQAAAQTLARAAGTVYNKADPGNDDQGFTLDEALTLMLASEDFRILHATATACDHVAVDLKPMRGCSNDDLLRCLAREQECLGQKARALREALADGRIDRTELREIKTAAYLQVRSTLELLARVEGMADART